MAHTETSPFAAINQLAEGLQVDYRPMWRFSKHPSRIARNLPCPAKAQRTNIPLRYSKPTNSGLIYTRIISFITDKTHSYALKLLEG